MDSTNVCLVDDDPDFGDVVAVALRKEFSMKVFENGNSFLESFQEQAPDIVLLDLELPDVNGLEICKRVKESGSNTSIVIVSGHDDLEHRLKCYDAGSDDFFSKPISVAELRAKLHNLEKYRQHEKELEEQEEMARNMAFESMTEASQYGELLRLFKELFGSDDVSGLTKAFFSFMDQLGLSACIQFRSPTQTYSFRAPQMPCSPLEENLFDGLVNAGRLYHFKNRTMVNDRHVSFLIKNMPVDDTTLYGRFNDHFAVLIEGLEERWSDIAKNRLVLELLQMLSQNMTQIDGQFKKFEKNSHEIINNLMLDMRSSLHVLDLLEDQENHIVQMVEEAVDQLYELSLEGHKIKDSLSESLQQFKDIYSKT